MQIAHLLNELTASYDAENAAPNWEAIIIECVELTPFTEAYVRYCVAKYVDRYY